MNNSGFTLVELAIVLMIIGLLIGGILKGQELIQNARITSQIRDLKNYHAAVISFQDSYAALPGDITNPGTRLPNCGATPASLPCNTAGNGNGLLGSGEPYNFWRHLSKANLLSNIDTEQPYFRPKGAVGSGLNLVEATINFGRLAFHMSDPMSGTGSLSSHQAGQIDRKMDDGKPQSGDVMGSGATCYNASVEYTGDGDETACTLLVKF